MSLYAKVENNIVSNIIVCDDVNIGLFDGIYVKITEDTNAPEIGSEYNPEKNKFAEIQPFASWTFNRDTLKWDAPSAKPNGNYHWSEENLEWVEFIPKPGPNYRWDEESNSWVEKED